MGPHVPSMSSFKGFLKGDRGPHGRAMVGDIGSILDLEGRFLGSL